MDIWDRANDDCEEEVKAHWQWDEDQCSGTQSGPIHGGPWALWLSEENIYIYIYAGMSNSVQPHTQTESRQEVV
jgi:hypothetical protein